MKPSQIITGSANSNPLTFTYTIYEDDVYYSYSSGSNVYILKGVSLKVIQVLTGHQSDVTCVSWLSNDTKLLTSSSHEIFLYVLNKERGLWEHVFTIPSQFEITALSWLQSNSFIVGGHSQIVKWKLDQQTIMKNYQINNGGGVSSGSGSSSANNNYNYNSTSSPNSTSSSSFGKNNSLDQEFSSTTTTNKINLNSSGNNTPTTSALNNNTQVRVNNEKFLQDQRIKEQKLFNKQAQIVWKTDSSSPINNLSCSPDGSFFATCGKFDRLIKVWFLQKKSKAKLLAEEQQIKLQQEQLSLLLQREELAKQKNRKGAYKEQFNKLTNKGPIYKANKIGFDEVVSSGGIGTGEDSNDINTELNKRDKLQKEKEREKGGDANKNKEQQQQQQQPQKEEQSIEELQKQLNQLKEIFNKQKNKKFEGETYGFIYLPHPRSITWISWRNRKTSTHNILLTNCKDGVVRLWQQSPQSRRLQFNVSSIIPSGSDIVDWVYSQNEDKFDIFNKNNEDNNINDEKNNSNSNNNNNAGGGFSGGKLSKSSSGTTGTSLNSNSNNNNNSTDDSNSYLRSHDFKLHLTNPILLRQKDSLAKTKQIVDWIIVIKLDGSLVLWKLRTDDSMTKQTSSLSIWINSQILSPQEIGPNRIISLYQPMSLTDNTPGSIKVCFNSFNGAISSRRFYIQNQNQTQITNASPVSRCYGHKSTIKKLAASKNSPYLSSLDYQNNVIIWNSTDSSKIQSPNYLIDIGSFPSYYSMTWSPNQKFCFFSNRDGIFVYYIEISQENYVKSSLLSIGMIEESTLEDDWIDEVHIVDPLNLIYHYNSMDFDKNKVNNDSSRRNGGGGGESSVLLPYQFFLIGLNKHSDKLYVWGVSVEKDFKYSSSSSPSILKSKLLATKEFERDSRISCICAAPKGIFDMTTINKMNKNQNEDFSDNDDDDNNDDNNNNNNNEKYNNEDRVVLTHPICITGSIDGYVSVFGITPKISFVKGGDSEEEIKFEDWTIGEMGGYHAYQQPVESVKAAYFGRFASKAFSTNPNPEIHIWELESHTPKLRLEDTIKFYIDSEIPQAITTTTTTTTTAIATPLNTPQVIITSPTSGIGAFKSPPLTTTILLKASTNNVGVGTALAASSSSLAHEDIISCCFSFVSLDDGSYSVAFGYGNQVKILNKPVDRVIGSYKRPWVQTHNYDDLTSPCSSLEWGKDLSLYVSAGNQIMVFTKWSKLNNINDNLALSQFQTVGHDYNTKLNSIYHQHSELQRPLPMYHPKFLTEYMMAGKFGVVEKILKHVCQFLFEKYDDLNDLPKSPVFIPPLSIEEIIHFDEFTNSKSKKTGTSDDMDRMNSIDKNNHNDRNDRNKDDDDDDDDDDDSDRDELENSNKFTKRQARKLSEILSSIKLGNLSSSEQIQLLAVTDTYGEIGEMRGGLDENGSRFILSAKVFQFLRRSLPPQDRPISLSTTDILWALHSEAQETILSTCFPTDPDWDALKQIGAGLWIKSPSTLINVVEKLAKTTYIQRRDPRECSLYYLALGKKGALVALHKASKDIKQVEFLSQDFTQAKWITAANKSAFLLQSKHKYELAASLFLLAGQLKKAVNLLLQMQGDFQLALVISRLYEGENGECSRMIIEDHIIPLAKKTNDRSLLSICNWLLKKYEDAITCLIPSVSIDGDRKLDEDDNNQRGGGGGGYSLGVSGNSTPIGMSSRNSMVSSPINRSTTGTNYSNATGTTLTTQVVSPISQQLRASQLGPSILYFFRFLKNHVQLRQLSEDKKKEDEFLRTSSYSYFNSGCSLLALENIERLEASHPTILTDNQERQEVEKLEKLKQQQQEKEKEKERLEKEKQKSNDLGLDFGGGGGGSGFFNKPSYDLGLDFGGGGGSSSGFFSKPSNDLGLDFGSAPSKPTSSSYMGLDFNTPTQSNSNDLGLDFGSTPSKPSTSSSYMGLDFNTPTQSSSSNSNNYGLDFGSTPSKPENSSSNYMGLDFNTPSQSSSSNNYGLDFGAPSSTTTNNNNNNRWELLDTTFIPSKKEKLSLYSLIDNELKDKLVVKVLLETIMETREADNWDEEFKDFKESLEYLCKKNQVNSKRNLIQLTKYNNNNNNNSNNNEDGDEKAMDILELISISIIKSLLRFDDDNILMLMNSSASQPLLTVSLEIYQSIMSIDKRYHSHSLILSTVYMMLFLLGYGSQRFDVLLVLFKNKNTIQQFNQFIDQIKQLPIRSYKDTENNELIGAGDNNNDDDDDFDMDDEDDDPNEILDKEELKRINDEKKLIYKFLKRFFDFLSLKYFKQCFDQLVKALPYHQVFDSVNQRLSLWIGSSQSKLLHVPQKILDQFTNNTTKTTIENFLELLKSYKEFNSTDQYQIWKILITNQKELLDHIILGIEITLPVDINGGNNNNNNSKVNKNNEPMPLKKVGSQVQFGGGSGKIKFEEEIEIYKDSDLLQSFCLDPTSPELNVMAIATTRGIREIDHKQLVSEIREEHDIDPSENLISSPSSSRDNKRPRITGKSVSSLNISKGKISTVFSGLRSSRQMDHNIIVQCLESHPNSSFYLSGGIDGSVCLWQFGIPEVLTAYQLPQKPRIVRCKFNQSGTKFGACDMAGNILLWQFAAQEDTLKPFYSLQAHSKQCLDFTFLNSGSLLATAGISSSDSKSRDICLWDVLLPPNKSLIASYTDQENGASSIVYSPKRQTIIVGGKKGSLSLYDIRTHKQLESFKAHHLNTKSLALDPFEEFVCSGSSDGNIKIWSLPSMTCLNTFEDAHKKQTFVRPTGVFKSPVSTYGVMQVRLENNGLFSCGSDGRVTKRSYYKL
ncbi:WD-40 repeat-containing protein [Dictyostelium discoideum AX4]|uniref:WD-40 repeat-containing protein n=2 Tax=Dictyostelium discoideum TaxID=44689 RepID=B0G145_DICDI|nr:WD-40 repeat-containing protein [Dictyostelium discoideum AX4]EDR41063.1 WD-40 repeat-containing protein [Dictyostelium discoideum AX4]|eukprot:XP_001733008.1 WD-40 repeat-containing protein [Dictyostelium discoideum AX4]